MEDVIYTDPFSQDFPEVADYDNSNDLYEAKVSVTPEQQTFVKELVAALKKVGFVPVDGKLTKLDKDFLNTVGSSQHQEYRFWKKSYLVTCPHFAEDNTWVPAKSEVFKGTSQVSDIWKDFHDSGKYKKLNQLFKGLKIKNTYVPSFLCVKLEDCISNEFYQETKTYTKLPRLKNFGAAFADTDLANAIVIGAFFLDGKSSATFRFATPVREQFCNGLAEFLSIPGVQRDPKGTGPKEGTDPGTPVEIEEETEEAASTEPGAEPVTEPTTDDSSETDHFETEEFKSTLAEIGFTESQIERLYKSGALKAIAALNLDDIEEGEEDHE